MPQNLTNRKKLWGRRREDGTKIALSSELCIILGLVYIYGRKEGLALQSTQYEMHKEVRLCLSALSELKKKN